ncbi:helicase [Zooshikella ganghwensis]|uniref:helicase n=1 Tax=Zooshikella ganghwensis TaxID=202772 RepID=UPI0004134DB4|nr:helicase [Zooshikella ganghwensis]
MIKLKLLLWVMGLLMGRASKRNEKLRKKLDDKQLTVQFQTDDQRVARHFIIENQKILSRSGVADQHDFAISFKDAGTGLAVLTAKNSQLAFMQAIQEKQLIVTGDLSQVMWFQGIAKYWLPR